MGVGQSTELKDAWDAARTFAFENKRDALQFLQGLEDVANLAQRGGAGGSETLEDCDRKDGRTLHPYSRAGVGSLDPQGGPASGRSGMNTSNGDLATNAERDTLDERRGPCHERTSSDPGDEASCRFTETEIRELFLPFQNIHLANWYLGDAALLDPQYRALPILGRNLYLTTLDLSFNALTSAVVGPLVTTLQTLQCVRRLSLAGNPIGAVGCHVLGEYLSTNNTLEWLSLFHCGLVDSDLVDLFNGLIPNDHLRYLNLDYNYCTVKTLQMVLQLTELNYTLAVVLLESIPHNPADMATVSADVARIEFVCTAGGVFRSGNDYLSTDDEDSATASWERWNLRRAVLRRDMVGRSLFPPHLVDQLESTLAPRREAYVAQLEEERLVELQDAVKTVLGGRDSRSGLKGDDLLAGHPAQWCEDSSSSKEEYDARPLQFGGRAAEECTAPLSTNDTTAEEDDKGDVLSYTCKALKAPTRRNPFSPLLSMAGGQHDMPFGGRSCKRCPVGRSALPPIHSKEYIRLAMADAYKFRRTLHGRTTKLGSRTLPNGFDKVVIPPPIYSSSAQQVIKSKGGLMCGPNYLANDAPRRLHPCWCDPHDAGVTYAGTLHYHCIQEEHIDYTQSNEKERSHDHLTGPPHRAKTSRLAADAKGVVKFGRCGRSTRTSGSSTLSLDSANMLGAAPGINANNTADILSKRRQGYHACKGTGHRCISATALSDQAGKGKLAHAAGATLDTRGGDASPALSYSSRACTKFTDHEGSTVELNYKPMLFFSAAYRPSADVVVKGHRE